MVKDPSTGIATMSSFGNPNYKDQGKPTFWKRNAHNVPGRPVYGAQHPPMQEKMNSRQTTPKKDKPRDSFQKYQEKTLDAWDDTDDELTLTAVKMNIDDVKSTALAVMQSHSEKANSSTQHGASGNDRLTQSASSNSDAAKAPNSSSMSKKSASTGRPSASLHHPGHVISVRKSNLPEREQSFNKYDKLQKLLAGPSVDLEQLRKACWSGISNAVRPVAWKILAGYLPANQERRELTLQRKRQEYFSFIDQYFHTRDDDLHSHTFRQIHIDIPRMNPLIPMFQQTVVQEIFERILFIWAIRHPASGYVQGMNDLVTPFFVVFLSEFIDHDIETENVDLSQEVKKENLENIEADSFWCMSKLLDGIQDNYTFAQPGIQGKVNDLAGLIERIDAPLHHHLLNHSVEYLQFAFRWMNNLLMREIPLRCIIRLWDTYLCEPDGFALFHLYVCAAFLSRFSREIVRERDFQGIMLTLQNLPTHHWKNEEISELLAEAFKLKYMFADAPKHLEHKK